jgi:hypothetical protein
MQKLRTLTVSQSVAVVFLSGLTVALAIAVAGLWGDLRERRALAGDEAIVAALRATGAVVHELQRERGLSAARLAAPVPELDHRIAEQRLRTDAALASLGAEGARLRTWLEERRAAADTRTETASAFRGAMTERIAALVAGIVADSGRARSPDVVRLTRTLATLTALKDTIGLERAMGAAILAQRSAGLAPSAEDYAELARQRVVRESWTAAFRLLDDADSQSFLDLWERSDDVGRFEGAYAALRDAPEDAVRSASLGGWIDGADEMIDALRAIEIDLESRIAGELAGELVARGRALALEAGLLALVSTGFSALAILTLRRIDRSIRGLIRTTCRLSFDTGGVRVDSYPQRDLDRIAGGLRMLQAVQSDRRLEREAAERIREDVEGKLRQLFEGSARGAVPGRLEVLGLDRQSASLARGVNQLLDQIERTGRAGPA